MNYETRDSGARQDFVTGSRRDTQDGKPRYDLISLPALTRWAGLMQRGAAKYGERNWELGQPLTRYESSLFRHLADYLNGDRVEDHLAAVLFNAGAIMHHEDAIENGKLAADLDDRPAERRARIDVEVATPPRVRPGIRVRCIAPPLYMEETAPDEIGPGAIVSVSDDAIYVSLDGGGSFWYASSSVEFAS